MHGYVAQKNHNMSTVQSTIVSYKSKMTHVHYAVVLICFLMNMCDGMNVMVVSYTAGAIAKDLAVNPASFGVVFSTGLLGMAVGAMLLASMADIFGRKPMIIFCALLMACGVLATAAVTNFTQLLALRFVTGLGIGSMLACTSALTAEYAPEKTKGFWVSFVMGGYSVGAVLSGLVAAKLIVDSGWRSIYFFAGITTLVTIPIVLFLLRESIEFLYKTQPANALARANKILAAMQLGLLEVLPFKSEKPEKATVAVLFAGGRKNTTVLLWASFLLCFAALYFLTSWIPKLASITGMSAQQSIYAGILFNAGAFIGVVTQGLLVIRFAIRKVLCSFLLGTALLMALFGFFTGPSLALLFFGLVGFGIQGGFTGLYAVAAGVYPVQIRGTGIGSAIGVGRLGAIAGPFFGGC